MRSKVVLFNRAYKWIQDNTIDGHGIAVTNKKHLIYPEVTGYYIPTLLEWGEVTLAKNFAQYLIETQDSCGGWKDCTGTDLYIFDTAQILKGLVAIEKFLPEAKLAIVKGCEWIISCMTDEGRLVTPSTTAWGEDDTVCSELIHTYCLTPLVDAAKLLGRPDFEEAALKIKDYYISNYQEKILNMNLLSHFYAYVMEGLWDMGEHELIRKAMKNTEKLQYANGGVKGLNNVNWVCSTGMFQLALVYYKMGEYEKGSKIFNRACALQNRSGGWYGSYPASILGYAFPRKVFRHIPGIKKHVPNYFDKQEISWAVKYFLDALSFRLKLGFEEQASTFLEFIDENDGRYKLIKQYTERGGDSINICDVGCGKGRYINRLIKEYPDNLYYAADISEKVMSNIADVQEKKTGALTLIPYEDEKFDLVYVCEALEHAVSIEGAMRELLRITKADGKLIIIDKPIEKLGRLKLDEWEQWIDDNLMKKIAEQSNRKLSIIASVPYENKDDGLFRAWIFE